MCNLSEGIEERGIKKGKLESISKLLSKGFNIEEACSLRYKVEDYLEYINQKGE